MDNTSNDDDVARLFRENDNIGSDSSLWLRPLRQLFKDGKPIGQFVALAVTLWDEVTLPFGMLTQTERNRLVFWPILPSGVSVFCGGMGVDDLDHITLEFPSEKIHVTAYNANGEPIHVASAWRTYHFPECDLALWFTLLVRVSILRQQDSAVQRLVKMPTTDKERRTDEFVRYTHNLAFSNISIPPDKAGFHYLYFGLFLTSGPITADQLPPSILPTDSSMDSQIEGWRDKEVFQAAVTPLLFGQWTICVVTACPPGRLRSDVSVGLPRSVESQSTRSG